MGDDGSCAKRRRIGSSTTVGHRPGANVEWLLLHRKCRGIPYDLVLKMVDANGNGQRPPNHLAHTTIDASRDPPAAARGATALRVRRRADSRQLRWARPTQLYVPAVDASITCLTTSDTATAVNAGSSDVTNHQHLYLRRRSPACVSKPRSAIRSCTRSRTAFMVAPMLCRQRSVRMFAVPAPPCPGRSATSTRRLLGSHIEARRDVDPGQFVEVWPLDYGRSPEPATSYMLRMMRSE